MKLLLDKFTSLRERFSRRDAVRFGIPVLALALIASVVAGKEKAAEPQVQPASRIDSRVQASEQDLDLSKLFRAGEEAKTEAASDPFARRSFAPAGQAAQAAAAPAAATAPPLPFRYLGKAIEDGQLSVFLARGDDSYSVHAKQKLDEQYRVDKVTGNSVTFTYLPLNQKQTLDIPAVN